MTTRGRSTSTSRSIPRLNHIRSAASTARAGSANRRAARRGSGSRVQKPSSTTTSSRKYGAARRCRQRLARKRKSLGDVKLRALGRYAAVLAVALIVTAGAAILGTMLVVETHYGQLPENTR